MTAITDELMKETMGKTKNYSIVILKAGVFVYEIHLCRSFPGDSLPK